MRHGIVSTAVRWLLVPLIFVVAGARAGAVELPGPLVDTGWLADHQGEVVVLDVREDAASYLGQPPPPDAKPDLSKLTGHIPGAVSVPWKQVVAKGAEQGVALKAMVPKPEAFADLMQASGVSKGSPVVIAGRGSTAKDQAHATRLYFTLKYFGHDNLALLDGGTAQWALEGRPLAYGPEAPARGDFAVGDVREGLLADTAELESAVASGQPQLIDCRTEDFFLGLTARRDLVAPEHKGHLPGAESLPFILLADNSGPARFFASEDVRKVAALKGVALDAPTIAYCNTGVTASLAWYTLHELLGNEQTRLYDGSMHAWSKLDPAHRVIALSESGDEPVAGGDAAASGGDALAAWMPAVPPSLQTLVDERRDLLRQRRNALFDAYTGRLATLPAWLAAHDDAVERYQDTLRQLHRRERDLSRLQHDAWMDAMSPWWKPQRDWSRQRNYLMQMEQLDRQELRDSYPYGTPFAFAGPAYW